MESEKQFQPKPEKPEFVYHGSYTKFDKPEPRLGATPDGEATPRLFASSNPAFAAAQGGFEWYSEDGVDVETEANGQIVLKVPKHLAHKLENTVYMYKLPSDTFTYTETEKTGHTWDSKESIELAEEPQTFSSVTEAVEYFGGRVELI